MATQHALDEAGIRQQIDKFVEAIRAMDLEGVTSFFAPDIVSFDVNPPLQHVGAEAKSKNWVEVFTSSSVRSVMRFAISRSPWMVT